MAKEGKSTTIDKDGKRRWKKSQGDLEEEQIFGLSNLDGQRKRLSHKMIIKRGWICGGNFSCTVLQKKPTFLT